MFRLNGKVALVTGSSSGIGAATATALAQAGADVALGWFGAEPNDLDAVRTRILKLGRRAIPLEADVRSTEQVESMVRLAHLTFGRLDIVVANAGIALRSPIIGLSDADWRAVLDVDLDGVLRCFRAAAPIMIRAKSGRFLTTTSTAGVSSGWAEHSNYSAAKAGLVGLVRALAVELGRYGITVSCVAPGVIETPQSLDPLNSLGPDGLQDVVDRIPLRRIGVADDVAAAFVFLASDDASYVTGQTVSAGVKLPR